MGGGGGDVIGAVCFTDYHFGQSSKAKVVKSPSIF